MAEQKMVEVRCPKLKKGESAPGLNEGRTWANRKKDGSWCCINCGQTHSPAGSKSKKGKKNK